MIQNLETNKERKFMDMKKKRENYQLFLLGIFLIAWIWAAINPITREGWLNENYVVFIGVPFLIFLIRYFKLSNLSVTLITIFMVLHVIGSHYPYPNVPWGFTIADWFNTARNQYDRFVHFCFGLLMLYPIREAFMKISNSKGFWTYYLPLDVILSFSALFEIIELIVVGFIKPDQITDFMGFQTDFWDATKDMLNAFIGALVTTSIIFIVNISRHRQARKELKKSFAIKNKNL
jgi:putative membrane protein